jgi:hypothetical protein
MKDGKNINDFEAIGQEYNINIYNKQSKSH